MIRKRKKFEWPKKLYDKPRILDENKLVEKYGLKNKKEIWKTEAKVKYFRSRAKSLINAEQEEQKIFFDKLNEIGLKVNNVSEVLALNKEDLLKRRLATIVWINKLANTARQARQMVVHKLILVEDNIVNIPGYFVKVGEENKISIKKKTKLVKSVEKPEKNLENESEEEKPIINSESSAQEKMEEENA